MDLLNQKGQYFNEKEYKLVSVAALIHDLGHSISSHLFDDWLNETGSADIVLLSSPGGNDALQGLPYSQAVSNINSIIDILQADNPNITIIVEQMAPGRSDIMTPELTDFFDQMQSEVLNIATSQTTSTSLVIAIDMFTGFNDGLLADDVHYNEAGADFIATRYYDTIINVLE